MTQLQSRNQNTANSIDSLSQKLEEMQRMFAEMQGELRVLSQQHKAQETLSKEWNKTTETVEKQFKDACSVYGSAEAIDDMVADIQTKAEAVKANFDDYSSSDRYLNQETAKQEDVVINAPLLIAVDEIDYNDDVKILSSQQIVTVLNGYSQDTVYRFRDAMEISKAVKKYESLAQNLIERQFTAMKLTQILNTFDTQLKLLA